jgi:hypothetical protein
MDDDDGRAIFSIQSPQPLFEERTQQFNTRKKIKKAVDILKKTR